MSKSVSGLGSLQSEVMELVWAREEATVAQLLEAISRKRPITYTTVLSAVQKLEKKGWLKYRVQGRAYVYRAAQQRTEVGRRTLREILKTAFSGDPRLLLSSLLDETHLSNDELLELRKLIEQRQKRKGKDDA